MATSASTRPTWRRLAALVLLPALALAACGDDGGDAAAASGPEDTTSAAPDGDLQLPDKITIGYQNIPNGDLVVKQNGWLEDAFGDGVDIEWTLFDSGGAVNEAVLAGSIDIGLAGSSPVSRGLSSGIDYQVPWIHDVIGDAEALVVRDDVTSIADLAGKRIATPFASTAHYSLLAALEGAGLTADDVELIDAEPDDIYAAWSRGDIDAAYVWNPNLAKIIEAGGKTLITSADLAEDGKTTYDLAVVRSAFAEEFPDAVEIWLEAEDRAVALIQDDPAAAAELIAVELNITPEEAADQLGDLVFVRAADQVGEDYLGGGLAANLFAAAQFNESLGEIDAVAEEGAYQDGVYTAAAQAVAAAGG
jgi:taurine transport system substrate-binding protein